MFIIQNIGVKIILTEHNIYVFFLIMNNDVGTCCHLLIKWIDYILFILKIISYSD